MHFKLNNAVKSGLIIYLSPSNSKWKLSHLKSLNTKSLYFHLDNLKITGDSNQDMILLHSNITLFIYVRIDGIVEIPNFDDADKLFRHKNFLMPQNKEPEYETCKLHYDCFSMLIASRLKNGSHDTIIISSKAKEVRSELDLNKKSSDDFEMIPFIIQHLVLFLGNNALSCDPVILVNSLKASLSGSCKLFHSKAQEIEDVLH